MIQPTRRAALRPGIGADLSERRSWELVEGIGFSLELIGRDLVMPSDFGSSDVLFAVGRKV
jgi:hypothetical protein